MRFWPKLKRSDWYLLLGLTLVYFLLNLLQLTRLPIFVDEALYLRWAQIAGNDATWRFISLTDGKQPLYTWFAIPFLQLIRDPLFAGRLASVVAGYFTTLGIGYSGWLIKSKRVGYLAVLLALSSPYLFFYNRFAVMESLLTAFGVWSFALSILLARYRRLDLAMILGIVIGFGMLVKSSALFYLLLSPAAYILSIDFSRIYTKQNLKYLGLLAVSWLIAGVIYNVQRLSPWMHVIADKNAFFTVPYSEIFSDPARLLNNFLDIFRWHYAYTTLPVVVLVIVGMYLIFRANRRMFFVLFIWAAAQLGGTAAIARLYAPRYIAFITPFLLLFAAYTLDSFKKTKARELYTRLSLILPIALCLILIYSPERFPFVPVDEGYVNGWTAGYGVKEASKYMVDVSHQSEIKTYLYTEGTFGILPHGIELYIDGKEANLFIEGIYPIDPDKVAKEYIIDRAKLNPTYMLINNTELESVPPNLELIHKWDKAYDTSMRLYQVIPPP